MNNNEIQIKILEYFIIVKDSDVNIPIGDLREEFGFQKGTSEENLLKDNLSYLERIGYLEKRSDGFWLMPKRVYDKLPHDIYSFFIRYSEIPPFSSI